MRVLNGEALKLSYWNTYRVSVWGDGSHTALYFSSS